MKKVLDTVGKANVAQLINIERFNLIRYLSTFSQYLEDHLENTTAHPKDLLATTA